MEFQIAAKTSLVDTSKIDLFFGTPHGFIHNNTACVCVQVFRHTFSKRHVYASYESKPFLYTNVMSKNAIIQNKIVAEKFVRKICYEISEIFKS